MTRKLPLIAVFGIWLTILILGIAGILFLMEYLRSLGMIIPTFVGWDIFFGFLLVVTIYYLVSNKTYQNYLNVVIMAGFIFYFTFSEMLWWFVEKTLFYIIYFTIAIVIFVWAAIAIGYLIFRRDSLEGKKFIEWLTRRKKKKFVAEIN